MLKNNSEKKIDRYISIRSIDRDRKFDKLTIADETKCNYIKEISTHLSKSSKKIRTPTIIEDDSQYNKKMYLTLLKTQIFNSNTRRKPLKENSSTTEHSQPKPPNHITPQFPALNKQKPFFVKNLNEMYFNSIATKTINTSNNFLHKNTFNQLDYSLFKSPPYSLSSFLNLDIEESDKSFNLLKKNNIPRTAYKVLDAPNLREDFYLNLLDWSCKDILAVGLDKILYIWNGSTSKVSQISMLEEDGNEYYSSLSWTKDYSKLLVGISSGFIEVYDAFTLKPISSFCAYSDRIDVISPMNLSYDIFSCGSQDAIIKSFDLRTQVEPILQMTGHKQEVCGLKWSLDDRRLASGGNDNKLIIWSNRRKEPEYKLTGHTSAVKALDWSPMKFGYLLSGGGSVDRTIKLWNTNTMTLVDNIDTFSQVCNVGFSRNSNEFVTTHGYSDNYILVWDAEKMDVKATLKGHKGRVTYMSMGPDSRRIVTGAGDETIRFWEVFNQDKIIEKQYDRKERFISNKKESSIGKVKEGEGILLAFEDNKIR